MWRVFYNAALVVAFMATYKTAGIFAATVVVISGVVGEIIVTLARRQRVDKLQWTGLCLVLVLGGSTLLFHNETFIKWRPTGVYWLIAGAFLTSLMVAKRDPVRVIIGRWVSAPDAVWRFLSWSWFVALVAVGAVNIVVAYTMSTDTWVNWRVFVAPGSLLALAVAQATWHRNYILTAWRDHQSEEAM
ncbi:septation protein IspZ [Rhodococcus opacus]|uniref:Septation protein IspZ n=1 Tax=Rhodococcus opacus TaxID=37919 RepID=A0ABT4NFD9_RHOOP|nr:septation protein IspZ [Rhodococcus opacus]MCZ4586109.1 septation protein IspZ [Rhodococcus opacus]